MRKASTVVPRPPCITKQSMCLKRAPKSAPGTSKNLPSAVNLFTLSFKLREGSSFCRIPTYINRKLNLHFSNILTAHVSIVRRATGILLNVMRQIFASAFRAELINFSMVAPRPLACAFRRNIKSVINTLGHQSDGLLNVPSFMGMTIGVSSFAKTSQIVALSGGRSKNSRKVLTWRTVNQLCSANAFNLSKDLCPVNARFSMESTALHLCVLMSCTANQSCLCF
mmetsp:Transcript_116264/g.183826  ORF Transcript_116264/g.183826 Transcript_116264/m.183826 type:complete len:225 (+) Transcript_116264:558-1232(+)